MEDLTGRVFGRWTVLGVGRRGHSWYWRCRCECGTEREVRGTNLRNGTAKSCGCFTSERMVAYNTTHGAFSGRNKRPTSEYAIWNSMIARCTNPKMHAFHHYGGRGITVCDRWRHDFAAFLADMGSRPSDDLSLDRIDNNRGYSPDNCRWATQKEQTRNKRNNVTLEWHGETLCLSEWAERTGISDATIAGRIKRGWTTDAVLSTPLRPHRRRGSDTVGPTSPAIDGGD